MSNELKRLKEQVRQARAELKAEKRKIKERDKESRPGFFKRLGNSYDNLVLHLNKHFQERAEDIEYKRNSPGEYEAKKTLYYIKKHVKYYEKVAAKGKTLSDKRLQLIGKMYTFADEIVEQHSSLKDEATEVKDRLIKLLPNHKQIQEAESTIQNFMDSVQKVMEENPGLQLPTLIKAEE